RQDSCRVGCAQLSCRTRRTQSWWGGRVSLVNVTARLLVVQPSGVDPADRLGEWLTEAGA
ncbi:MAG: hypothetical protein ACRDSH_11180, partial [Pseudonocardiaceae bacterium]